MTARSVSGDSEAAAVVLDKDKDSTSSINIKTSCLLSCSNSLIAVNTFTIAFPDSLNQRENKAEEFNEINKQEEKIRLSRIASF